MLETDAKRDESKGTTAGSEATSRRLCLLRWRLLAGGCCRSARLFRLLGFRRVCLCRLGRRLDSLALRPLLALGFHSGRLLLLISPLALLLRATFPFLRCAPFRSPLLLLLGALLTFLGRLLLALLGRALLFLLSGAQADFLESLVERGSVDREGD